MRKGNKSATTRRYFLSTVWKVPQRESEGTQEESNSRRRFRKQKETENT